jgi:protein SCO1/2
MKKAVIAGSVALVLVALGTSVAFRRAPKAEPGFRSGIFDPPRDAPAFSLDGSNGKKLSPRDYLGKVVILEFGFTYCQYVCPITLARLTEVHKKLGSAADEVQLIFVTVDPARDSPERLREHLTTFNPNFLGATGTNDELQAVYKSYGIVAEREVSKNKALGYEMNHSSFLYLIDRTGKIRGLVPFGTPADTILHDVDLLLKSQT